VEGIQIWVEGVEKDNPEQKKISNKVKKVNFFMAKFFYEFIKSVVYKIENPLSGVV
jgi:hypothetical protein